MRTFLLAATLPYPPRGGPDLRVSSLVRALGALGPVAVFGVIRREDEQPAPDTVALARSADDPELRARWTSGPGPSAAVAPSAPYHAAGVELAVAAALQEFRPDLVVLDQVYLADYLPVLRATGAPVVLDTHNVETDLQRQIAAGEAHPALRLARRAFADRIEELERRVVSDVDAIWVCSDADRERLMKLHSPTVPISVVPNTVDVGAYEGVWASTVKRPHGLSDRRPTVVFPGQFSYPPNADAAATLVQETLPRLRSTIGDVRLLLVGRGPTARMLQAAEDDADVIVTGAVPSITPYLAASTVMAIPLRSGGGTRFKLLEAFASGVPVVSTPLGAEGLDIEDGTHAVLADVPAISDAIVRLLQDRALRLRLRSEARRLVRERFSDEAARDSVAAAAALLGPRAGAR